MIGSQYELENTIEDFTNSDAVNVEAMVDNFFAHDFTGTVKGINGNFVVVEDQDGNWWDCDPRQLSHNTDNIMHAQSHQG